MNRLCALLVTACLWTACAHEPATTFADVIGTWSLSDADNELFHVLIEPDGKCISTWWKGAGGAAGQIGTWTMHRDTVVLRWVDGHRTVIAPRAGALQQQTTVAHGEAGAAPESAGPVVRTGGPLAQFAGVWLSCASAPRKAVHLAIRADGLCARSSGEELTLGTCVPADNAVTLIFADGVVHRLRSDQGRWSEDVFSAGSAPDAKPAASGSPTRY